MSVLRVSHRFTGCSLRNLAGPLTHRSLTTTGRKYAYDEGTDSAEPDTPRNSSSGHLSWERFFQLDKDVAVMRIQLTEMSHEIHEIKSDLKDLGKRMDSKIDCLVYFFLGGLVLKGGFDFYMKEAQKDVIKK